jgi:hypothetical protein
MTDQQNPHYVTPEEAEHLFCPMSKSVFGKSKICSGPQCMAWRWRPKGHQDLMQGAMLQLPLVPEEPMTHGYCGMVKA